MEFLPDSSGSGQSKSTPRKPANNPTASATSPEVNQEQGRPSIDRQSEGEDGQQQGQGQGQREHVDVPVSHASEEQTEQHGPQISEAGFQANDAIVGHVPQ